MSAPLPRRPAPNGFTLLELLIPIAFIAVLFIVVAPGIIDYYCLHRAKGAKAAISRCDVAIGQSSVQKTLLCLAAADKVITKFAASEECFRRYRSVLVTAAITINEKIDAFTAQSAVKKADKQFLEAAKISIPPPSPAPN